jgi:hypothetical protein
MDVIGMDDILSAGSGFGSPHPTHGNPGIRKISDLIILDYRVIYQSAPDSHCPIKLQAASFD